MGVGTASVRSCGSPVVVCLRHCDEDMDLAPRDTDALGKACRRNGARAADADADADAGADADAETRASGRRVLIKEAMAVGQAHSRAWMDVRVGDV